MKFEEGLKIMKRIESDPMVSPWLKEALKYALGQSEFMEHARDVKTLSEVLDVLVTKAMENSMIYERKAGCYTTKDFKPLVEVEKEKK